MSDAIDVHGDHLMSAAEAAQRAGLSADYLTKLCRLGKLAGQQINRTWFIESSALDRFLIEQAAVKEKHSSALSNELRAVAERADARTRVGAAYPAHARTPSSLIPPELAERREPSQVFEKLGAAALAIALTFGAATAASPNARAFAQQSIDRLSAIASTISGAPLSAQPAAVVAAIESAPAPSQLATSSVPSGVTETQGAETIVERITEQPIIEQADTQPLASADFVTQDELQAQLLGLSDVLTQKFRAATSSVPQYVAAGGNVFDYSAPIVPAIDNLSNVTISNPNSSGGSISNASISGSSVSATSLSVSGDTTLTGNLSVGGTISGAISASSSVLTDLTATDATATNLFATNASTTNATSTNFFAAAGTITNAILTTLSDAAATITDLTATNATTTNATSTNLYAANASTTNATSTNLFASIANFTTGIVNALSGTTLTYTAATTTNLAVYGSAQFGGTATTTIDSAGDLAVAGATKLQNATTTNLFADSALSASAARFGATATSSFSAAGALTLANLASAVLGVNQSGEVVATTSIGTSLLAGSLGTINGTSLPAGGSVTITAASSTLLGDSNTFSGTDTFNATISGSVSGNAGTATALQTTRTINGVSFNGTSNIVINAASSTALSDVNDWTGLQSFANASTTLGTIATLWLPNVSANSLAYLNGNNQVAAAAVSYPLQFSGGSLSLAFGTTTGNAWSQLQTLQSGFVSQASSTVVGNFTTTGTNTLTGASNFTGLGTFANGFLSQASSTIVGPLTLTGTLSAQGATFNGTPAFNTGLLSLASSTIGNGSQAGGLTISGGATTTGNAYFAGNVGVGVQPYASEKLQILGSGGTTGFVTFGNSSNELGGPYVGVGYDQTNDGLAFRTNSGSSDLNQTPMFIQRSSGNVGIGTTTPWAQLSVNPSGVSGPAFAVGSSTATNFVVTNGGNIGIGTTSPATTLSIAGNGYLTGSLGVGVLNTTAGTLQTSGAATVDGTFYADGSSGVIAQSNGAGCYTQLLAGSLNSNCELGIQTGMPYGLLLATDGGDVRIGANSNTGASQAVITYAGNGTLNRGLDINDSASVNGSIFTGFQVNGTMEGNITNSNNTGVSYNTTSDRRLKTDISTSTEGLSTLMQIPVFNFAFKSDPNKTIQQGFIAQTLEPVYPEAVTTNGDNGIVPLGPTSTPWAVDYGRITPLIVSAVQDIANISSTFEQNLIAWLGNAQNGIQDLYATVVHATTGDFATGNFSKKLCVGSTCVTPAQFQAMVAAASASQSSGQGSGNPSTEPTAATSSDQSKATDTAPQIQINGDNPAIVQVGATYQDLGATITGPQADLNLGIHTFVNGVALSPVQIDTSAAATDTIDYVVTDQHGLTSTTTRTVIIEAPSLPAPVIVANLASSPAASSTTETTAPSTPSATQATSTVSATTTTATSTSI